MKKVLIIGTVWPHHLWGGARVPGLAKYISEFGWEPIVLTQPLPRNLNLNYRVVEIPFNDILISSLKLLRFDTSKSIRMQVNNKLGVTSKNSLINTIFCNLRDMLTYPDLNKGWISPALRAGDELLKKENIDAIISASPPMMVNIIAKKLTEKYEIPWIADFPHLWSQNNYYPHGSFRMALDTRLELKTLSTVDVLTTTSEQLAEKLRALHKGKPIYAITHGFDPDILNTVPDALADKFTITYTGSWNPATRRPSKLFCALETLIQRGNINPNDVEVHFYGPEEGWIDDEINKYKLTGIVKQHGRISMQDAQAKQRKSHLLFNAKMDDITNPGIHSSKLIEYLAARRPILAVGMYKDVVDELLDKTSAGICASSIDEVMQALEMMYHEYKSTGNVPGREMI